MLLNSTLSPRRRGRAASRPDDGLQRLRAAPLRAELLEARTDAETRARSALALENVSEAVILVSLDGRIDVLNRAAEALFDLSAKAAVGRPASELIPDWPTVVERTPVARPGDPVASAELPFARAGHELWLATSGSTPVTGSSTRSGTSATRSRSSSFAPT